MRHPLGVQRHQHVGADPGGAHGEPHQDQRRRALPQLIMRQAVRGGEQADDPAEQQRVEELQPGHHDVGQAEQHGQADVPAEHRKNAAVDGQNGHEVYRSCIGSGGTLQTDHGGIRADKGKRGGLAAPQS